MPVVNFKQNPFPKGDITGLPNFDTEGYPLWVTVSEGKPLRIADMTDQHLMNSISFVKRKFREWHSETLSAMEDMSVFLRGEMADLYLSKDIGDVEEMTVDEWCPRLKYLELEAGKRNLL